MPDANDYPTDEELERVRNFAMPEGGTLRDWLDDMMALVETLWNWPDRISKTGDGMWELHTGGWSGNETVVDAMMSNTVWWMMFWQQTRRGGHYLFGV